MANEQPRKCDPSDPRSACRQKKRWFGTITRLMPSKGNEYLVKAARLVLDESPETRFCIVTEGELRSDLEALARRLGVAGRVHFAGFKRAVAGALAASDVVAFPSSWEGTPLTAVEALAAGRPIVAHDAHGLADILHPIGTRSSCRSGMLARAIVALLCDPARRAELAGAAAVTGAAFDVGVFVRKLERLYELMDTVRRTTGAAASQWRTSTSCPPSGTPLEPGGTGQVADA